MKKIFFSLVISAVSLSTFAQEAPRNAKEDRREKRKVRIAAMAKQEEEGVIAYRKHFAAGAKLTNDGYGGFLEIGRAQSVKRALLFQLEITEHKYAKEEKQQINYSNTTPIIFGKINYFYPVKLGVQQQFLLGNKGNKNGVSVSANVGGGVSIGLLRPYKIGVDSAGTQVYIGVKNDTALFLNQSRYIGGPSIGTGFNELTVKPGAYAKAALRFDYGKFNEMLNALEVGVTAEYYSKYIPFMLASDVSPYALRQKKFFFNAYVAIMFGKRK
jgi:hypothetical protein